MNDTIVIVGQALTLLYFVLLCVCPPLLGFYEDAVFRNHSKNTTK